MTWGVALLVGGIARHSKALGLITALHSLGTVERAAIPALGV